MLEADKVAHVADERERPGELLADSAQQYDLLG